MNQKLFIESMIYQTVDLYLDSYLTPERCNRKSIPQSEDGFPSLWKDGTCKLDEFIRKNAEAIYAAKSEPSCIFWAKTTW